MTILRENWSTIPEGESKLVNVDVKLTPNGVKSGIVVNVRPMSMSRGSCARVLSKDKPRKISAVKDCML